MGFALLGVNLWAVLVAALGSMVVGSLWYSKILFLDIWSKLAKVEMKKGKGNPWVSMLLGFAGTIFMSFILTFFMTALGANTLKGGLILSFMIWFGFLMVRAAGSVLWEQRPVKLFFINTMHDLISILVMGAIISGFI